MKTLLAHAEPEVSLAFLADASTHKVGAVVQQKYVVAIGILF